MSAPTKTPSSAPLLRDFTDALSQQMYFWGRDVIHPSGNLLVAHGFDRRKSGGLDGTSCYRLPLEEGYIELHGACAGWYPGVADEPGFLYIRTRRRCYLYDGPEPPAPGFYSNELLRTTPGPDLVGRSRRFLAWWLDYERWIAVVTGPGYRGACHRTFAKLPNSPPWLPPAAGLDWLRRYHRDPAQAGRAMKKHRRS
jgi:hypothetical protein